jgi:hypothetical protein
MMHPYMTLNEDTEIAHSEMKPDGRVKVYIETPNEKGCRGGIVDRRQRSLMEI